MAWHNQWHNQWSPEEWLEWKTAKETARLAADVPEVDTPETVGDTGTHWTQEEWQTWDDDQAAEAAFTASVVAKIANWGSGERDLVAVPDPAPATAEDAPDAATVSEALLLILATTWEDPYGFKEGDAADEAHWQNVAICLERNGVNMLSLAPARNVLVSWKDQEYWKDTCWWCGMRTNPVHSKAGCEDYRKVLTEAFRQLLAMRGCIPEQPPIMIPPPDCSDGDGSALGLPLGPVEDAEMIQSAEDAALQDWCRTAVTACTVAGDRRSKGGEKKNPKACGGNSAAGPASNAQPTPEPILPPPAAKADPERPKPDKVLSVPGGGAAGVQHTREPVSSWRTQRRGRHHEHVAMYYWFCHNCKFQNQSNRRKCIRCHNPALGHQLCLPGRPLSPPPSRSRSPRGRDTRRGERLPSREGFHGQGVARMDTPGAASSGAAAVATVPYHTATVPTPSVFEVNFFLSGVECYTRPLKQQRLVKVEDSSDDKLGDEEDGCLGSNSTESGGEASGAAAEGAACAAADPEVAAVAGRLAALAPVTPTDMGIQPLPVPPTPPMPETPPPWLESMARPVAAAPAHPTPADPSACPAAPGFYDGPTSGDLTIGPPVAPTAETVDSAPASYRADTVMPWTCALAPAPAADPGASLPTDRV